MQNVSLRAGLDLADLCLIGHGISELSLLFFGRITPLRLDIKHRAFREARLWPELARMMHLGRGSSWPMLSGFTSYPYLAKAGSPTFAGRRRTRAPPASISPAVSWS